MTMILLVLGNDVVLDDDYVVGIDDDVACNFDDIIDSDDDAVGIKC